jgi:hypothetical protein
MNKSIKISLERGVELVGGQEERRKINVLGSKT